MAVSSGDFCFSYVTNLRWRRYSAAFAVLAPFMARAPAAIALTML
jgi:hypothetical protein